MIVEICKIWVSQNLYTQWYSHGISKHLVYMVHCAQMELAVSYNVNNYYLEQT